MPSDSDVSRLKHRRSSPSDEEAGKSSKRHKHRHHRSKKHDNSSPPRPPVVSVNDDDVEEGEILEEDKDVELRHVDSDSLNLEVQAGKSSNGFVEKSISDSNDDKVHTNLETYENGDLGYEYNDDDDYEKRRLERSSRKKTSYPDDDTAEGDRIKLSEHRKSSERDRDKHNIVENSRSRKTYGEEVYTRRRSVSRDGSRERSYSQSRDLTRDVERERNGGYSRYFEEEDMRKKERARDGEPDRNPRRDSHREGSRDTAMQWDRRKERERGESRDRDKRREADRDLSRDRGMDRDHRREREREKSRDRELEQDWRRENDRGSRDWEVDRDPRRDRDRERSRDRELEKERLRDKERERSKEREKELDKYRQRDRDRSKDMYRARSSERYREREKDSDRYRDRFRDGGHDWESQKERERRNDRNRDNARDRKSDLEKVQISNSDSAVSRDKLSRDEDEQDDFEEKISLKLAEQEEEDLERIKEESRKRRQAILEKYKKKQLQEEDNRSKGVEKDERGQQPTEAAQFAKVASESPDGGIDGGDAAVADPLFSVGKSPAENGVQASQRVSGAAGLGEGIPKSERSNDKYCDDIFGETPSGVRKMGKEDGLPVTGAGFHDNWDDPEGYYSYRFGEVLDSRYEVAAGHGKGVFSTVVRAKDLKAGPDDPEEVAIKIIRNNETMNKAGKEEVQILKKLAALDPENKRHCVRFVSSFKYRNHLCLVFESLHMNLREVLKKFGRNIGLKLTAVRAYAKQLFIALKHLKNCGVLHCDIKPDNMLVNEAKNVLKLCDFGNAMSAGKNEITPYLVSRFYRAPEIILGLSYDHPMDMWSVGCCLYELYTGKVLFPGATNNDMLRLHMELKGPFPKKMLKKGAFVDQHFDQDLNFLATEEDPVTKKIVKRMLANIKPKDIGSIITGSLGEDPKMLANFKDLLDKIFVLDPEKRMTVQQALSHPFITGK